MRNLVLILTLLSLPSLAAEEQKFEAVPEPPPIPERVKSGETLEPEVTIIKREDATVHEYRANGQLYMVKIVPARGKPYYLIDTDGDGQLESRSDELEQDFHVPHWVIFSW